MSVEFNPQSIRILVEPTVYVLGRQVVNDAELERFLSDHGVSWQTDTEIASELRSNGTRSNTSRR